MRVDSKRRLFLSMAGYAPLLWEFGSSRVFAVPSFKFGEGFLCSPGRTPDRRFVLQTLRLGDQSQQTLNLPFLAHSVCFAPEHQNRAAVLPQRPGLEACIVDLERNRIDVRIQPRAGESFYGHGAYSSDGNLLYLAATDGNGGGALDVRNPADGELIARIDTFGPRPHDLAVVDDGALAMICNWGIPPFSARSDYPSLVTIDLASGKLLAQEFVSSRHISIRHLSALNSETAAVAVHHETLPDPKYSCVALKRSGTPLTLMPNSACPHSLGGTALSASIHPGNRIAGFTHPAAGYLSFWSLDDFSCLKTIAMPDPQGIAVSPNGRFFLATGTHGIFAVVDTDTLEVVSDVLEHVSGFNWRHASVLPLQG